MASRIEDEYARRMLEKMMQGGPADSLEMPRQGIADSAVSLPALRSVELDDAATNTGRQLQQEMLRAKLRGGPADPEAMMQILEPSRGEMMMSDAKTQAMSKSQRRRMRRRKLEEALRNKAREMGEDVVSGVDL